MISCREFRGIHARKAGKVSFLKRASARLNVPLREFLERRLILSHLLLLRIINIMEMNVISALIENSFPARKFVWMFSFKI